MPVSGSDLLAGLNGATVPAAEAPKAVTGADLLSGLGNAPTLPSAVNLTGAATTTAKPLDEGPAEGAGTLAAEVAGGTAGAMLGSLVGPEGAPLGAGIGQAGAGALADYKAGRPQSMRRTVGRFTGGALGEGVGGAVLGKAGEGAGIATRAIAKHFPAFGRLAERIAPGVLQHAEAGETAVRAAGGTVRAPLEAREALGAMTDAAMAALKKEKGALFEQVGATMGDTPITAPNLARMAQEIESEAPGSLRPPLRVPAGTPKLGAKYVSEAGKQPVKLFGAQGEELAVGATDDVLSNVLEGKPLTWKQARSLDSTLSKNARTPKGGIGDAMSRNYARLAKAFDQDMDEAMNGVKDGLSVDLDEAKAAWSGVRDIAGRLSRAALKPGGVAEARALKEAAGTSPAFADGVQTFLETRVLKPAFKGERFNPQAFAGAVERLVKHPGGDVLREIMEPAAYERLVSTAAEMRQAMPGAATFSGDALRRFLPGLGAGASILEAERGGRDLASPAGMATLGTLALLHPAGRSLAAKGLPQAVSAGVVDRAFGAR